MAIRPKICKNELRLACKILPFVILPSFYNFLNYSNAHLSFFNKGIIYIILQIHEHNLIDVQRLNMAYAAASEIMEEKKKGMVSKSKIYCSFSCAVV